ncbi:MAG TPA: hypothetical protein VG738_10230 [Chitinophagaceae bacterium]|nr:hypothetical protein [Chitinophagaceae bacterium]
MKTRLKTYKLLFVSAAMLITTHLLANGGDAEKTKSYSKSYAVSSTDNITIDNRFGETRLETWNSNEVKVDVQIRVVASSDDRAQSLIDDINIEDGKSSNGVYFRTNIDNHRDNGKGHTEMHIDYVVHLPANNPLTLDTQFGDTYLPDYNGHIDIENKFGSLKAGNIKNAGDIDIEFGKADIEGLNNGKLTIKYSGFTLGKMSGDIDARFEFCDASKISIDNNIKSLDLYNSYSTVKISTSKDLSATFDIETHFGDFSNHTDFSIKEDADKNQEWRSPRFDYHYQGKAGSGSTMIKIKSNFGSTTIM